jgi:hypothetical protein
MPPICCAQPARVRNKNTHITNTPSSANNQAHIDPGAFEQAGYLGGSFKGFGLRKVVAQGIFPRAINQKAQAP